MPTVGNLRRAFVQITGTRTLLWHAFHREALSLEATERTGKAGNDPLEWRRTVLYDSQTRQLYVPDSYIFGAVRDGAKSIKAGRGSIQSAVTSTLMVEQSRIMIDKRYLPAEDSLNEDPDEPVFLHVAGVRNPATRGQNVRYRIAASPGWTAQFTIFWDASVVNGQAMRQAVEFAGLLCGVGDGRKIGFGRFKLTGWKVEVAQAEELEVEIDDGIDDPEPEFEVEDVSEAQTA